MPTWPAKKIKTKVTSSPFFKPRVCKLCAHTLRWDGSQYYYTKNFSKTIDRFQFRFQSIFLAMVRCRNYISYSRVGNTIRQRSIPTNFGRKQQHGSSSTGAAALRHNTKYWDWFLHSLKVQTNILYQIIVIHYKNGILLIWAVYRAVNGGTQVILSNCNYFVIQLDRTHYGQ